MKNTKFYNYLALIIIVAALLLSGCEANKLESSELEHDASWKGELDTTFNGKGYVVHHNAAGGNGLDAGEDIIVQPDGKILVVGYSEKHSVGYDMVIWRYKEDGSLDSDFGAGGVVVHRNATGENETEAGHAVVLDKASGILVTGYVVKYGWNKDMAIWRYKPNGVLDNDFGDNGVATHHSAANGNSYDAGYDIIVDSKGRILVTGYSENTHSLYDMVIWRYNSDGSLDATFNNKGYVAYYNIAEGSTVNFGRAITIDANDKILVAGYSRINDNIDMAVWRYNSNGSLDTTFNNKGYVIHGNAAGGNGVDAADDIVVQPDGGILVTGHSDNSGGDIDMIIWRYKPDGKLDASFSNNGLVRYSNAAGLSVALAADNGILISGSTGEGSESYMAVWRYDAYGKLDRIFTHDIDVGNHDQGCSLVVDAEGRALVSGSTSADSDMVIWRVR